MALIPADLVLETTTTTGTGTLTLAGVVTGHHTFAAAVGEGNTCLYSIEASNGQKETGIGTVGSGTLERTTLKASSTGSKLDLPAGTHYVGVTANSAAFTVSGPDKLLGRATAGPGAFEEIPCTAAGRALLDDTTPDAQRQTLRIFVQDTEPPTPAVGDVWIDKSINTPCLAEKRASEVLAATAFGAM
jgi:hypothetical protein